MILKRNIQLLLDNPKAKIRIVGYTSASGTKEYNQKLSERRANSVEKYLIEEGKISNLSLEWIYLLLVGLLTFFFAYLLIKKRWLM